MRVRSSRRSHHRLQVRMWHINWISVGHSVVVVAGNPPPPLHLPSIVPAPRVIAPPCIIQVPSVPPPPCIIRVPSVDPAQSPPPSYDEAIMFPAHQRTPQRFWFTSYQAHFFLSTKINESNDRLSLIRLETGDVGIYVASFDKCQWFSWMQIDTSFSSELPMNFSKATVSWSAINDRIRINSVHERVEFGEFTRKATKPNFNHFRHIVQLWQTHRDIVSLYCKTQTTDCAGIFCFVYWRILIWWHFDISQDLLIVFAVTRFVWEA